MNEDRFEELVRIAGAVSRETFERLLSFERAVVKWNNRINLIASSTIPELWARHILDSAQLFSLKRDTHLWLDVGSGGGFPGAVTAILLRERAGASIQLVESNRKKAAFLQSVLGELQAPAMVHARRIEDTYKRAGQPEVVTARALAALPALLTLTEPWLSGGAVGLFHKGRDYAREVEESGQHWRFRLIEHPSATNPDGVILEVADLERR